MKVNPFRPGHPIVPGMFVGRLSELEALESALIQTKSGQPINFMLTGERGIGKTSLLNYLRWQAQGDIDIDGSKVNFLVIDTDVDQNTTQIGLIKKIKLGLNRQLGATEPARKYMADAWSFLKRVEAAGVRVADSSVDDELILEEFSYSLAQTIDRVCNYDKAGSPFNSNYDGILLLIDEADNSSPDLHLGTFFKLLTERLQRHSCDNFMIGLAGLPDLRNVLVNSHPSSLRIFEELPLGRLSETEVKRVVSFALKKANEVNDVKTTINQEGMETLVDYAEGYPHFIQQFGYSAFDVDSDNIIDRDDVGRGAFGARGAMEKIGDSYYRNDFYNKIQKDSYRQVLRIMAEKLDDWVTKEEIKRQFKGKSGTLDNAIKALRDRHIILSKEGTRGVYRLQHKGFALWIKLYTEGK